MHDDDGDDDDDECWEPGKQAVGGEDPRELSSETLTKKTTLVCW